MTVVADFTSFAFTVSRDDIIRLAMTDAGALGVGEEISAEDLSYCVTKLNMLVKQWQGTADFAPGLKMWSRKHANLFLRIGQAAYDLGGSDRWTQDASLSTTALTVNAAAAAATITLADPSGVADGTRIGISLDSGASHWTQANGGPVGSVVTLQTIMPSAAAAGNQVFAFDAIANRPLQLLSVVLRDRNGHDIPLDPMTIDDYSSLPAKADANTTGNPSAYYYEAQISAGRLYLDRYPANVAANPLLHIVYLSPIQDLVEGTDTPDYPQNWYRALAAQLAMDIVTGFQLPASKELMALRNDAVSIARNQDGEITGLYFQPGVDYE